MPPPAAADGWLPGAFNQGWSYRDRIDAASAALGVVDYYSARHRHSEEGVWLLRLENGEISCNGEVVRQERRLQLGDRLLWRRPPWWEGPVPAVLPSLYDDGDLLVLAKPSGLPVLPAGGWLDHTVLRLLERRHHDDPDGIPRPVHRLGRFTSGLLVCARQTSSRAWLSAQLRDSTAALAAGSPPTDAPRPGPAPLTSLGAEPLDSPLSVASPTPPPPALPPNGERGQGRPAAAATTRGRPSPCDNGDRTRKVYRALLAPGRLDLAPGTSRVITVPIGRHPHPHLGEVWAAGGAAALPARSLLTLLETRADADLVEVVIQSGRPHQIRIHCAALGAPLLGDPLYRSGGLAESTALPGDGGYHLHAAGLCLQPPQAAPLVLWAPPPPPLCREAELRSRQAP